MKNAIMNKFKHYRRSTTLTRESRIVTDADMNAAELAPPEVLHVALRLAVTFMFASV